MTKKKFLDLADSRAYPGYLVSSVFGSKCFPEIKDILCRCNEIPDQFDAANVVTNYVSEPVTRISEHICVKNKDSECANIIFCRYKNGKEYVYVPDQLRDSSKGCTYDFVQSGFFDEEDWLDYQGENPTFSADFNKLKNMSDEKTGDVIFDTLRQHAKATMVLPGIGMFDPYRNRIDSFIFTNHPGEDGQGVVIITPALSLIKGVWTDYELVTTRTLESLWIYKEFLNDDPRGWGKWLYFPTYRMNGKLKRYNLMLSEGSPLSGFIIMNPLSEGYIAYDCGVIRINLVKSIDHATGAVEEYELDNKISVAREILKYEYDWINQFKSGLSEENNTLDWNNKFFDNTTTNTCENFLKSLEDYKYCLNEISSILDLWEGTSIFSSIPKSGYSADQLTLSDIFEPDRDGFIANEELLKQVVRSGNIVPIPVELKDQTFEFSCKSIDSEPDVVYYEKDSLYARYKEYMSLDFNDLKSITFRDPNQLDLFKKENGWLRPDLSDIKVYFLKEGKMIDLSMISNLPNVSPEDLKNGKFMYREVIEIPDSSPDTENLCLARDVWYATKDIDHIQWVLSWTNQDEADEGEYPTFSDGVKKEVLEFIKFNELDPEDLVNYENYLNA
jgi:hypothetical protein